MIENFRTKALDALDEYYILYDDHPDYIMIDSEVYNFLEKNKKFEKLADENGNESSEFGYLGMRIWGVTLPENVAILFLTKEEFNSIFPTAKDFYVANP